MLRSLRPNSVRVFSRAGGCHRSATCHEGIQRRNLTKERQLEPEEEFTMRSLSVPRRNNMEILW